MNININIKKQAGFNLIEVLLAFLILSIGLLGVAGLQTTAVKASHTSMLRTIAITKVQEVIARIRSNTAAPIIEYAQVKASSSTLGEDKNCDGLAAVECVPLDVAKNDVFTWGNSLTNAGLPNDDTQASIVINDAFTPPIATISVFWQERGEEMSYATTIQ